MATSNGWNAKAGLPEGALDIVGDIHGGLGALRELMHRLGYAEDGEHREGRTLVFLGDLIDRGPDSPGVIALVEKMIARGRAVAVMGNHDLNAVSGRQKHENTWLFGHGPSEGERLPDSNAHRDDMIAFLATLPVAMERSDVRVVHACWDDAAIGRVMSEGMGPGESYKSHRSRIHELVRGESDAATRSLRHQNENPIRLVTAGPEVRAAEPYFAAGKMRSEQRHAWWESYTSGPMVVFGHYWRIPVRKVASDRLFEGMALDTVLTGGRAMCIDYSVGGRAAERREGKSGSFSGRLAALRWPERELVFDDGEVRPMREAV